MRIFQIFAIVISGGIITAMQFAMANDSPERGPLIITIDGSHHDNAAQERAKNFNWQIGEPLASVG